VFQIPLPWVNYGFFLVVCLSSIVPGAAKFINLQPSYPNLSLCVLQVQISHAIAAGENHYHSTWAPELVCDCDLVSLRRKMKTGRNKNMWYYKCCNWEVRNSQFCYISHSEFDAMLVENLSHYADEEACSTATA
jgi:hypothetical protein